MGTLWTPNFCDIVPLCPLWLLWPSLHLYCFFVVVTTHAKYDPLAQFVLSPRLFSCPPVPLHPKAPIKTPCAPIRGHSCIFFCFWQNMMSGEISPVMGPWFWSARPLMTPVCLVFVFAMPPEPQCTHAHPSAPIYIHFYPCAPCVCMYMHVI